MNHDEAFTAIGFMLGLEALGVELEQASEEERRAAVTLGEAILKERENDTPHISDDLVRWLDAVHLLKGLG